jgi:hypothetical protein
MSLKCDICYAETPTWDYPVKSFQMPALNWVSIENWAACDTCHDLIEADDRIALNQRSLGTFILPDGSTPPEWERPFLLEIIEQLNEKFYANRLGPATLISQEELAK